MMDDFSGGRGRASGHSSGHSSEDILGRPPEKGQRNVSQAIGHVSFDSLIDSLNDGPAFKTPEQVSAEDEKPGRAALDSKKLLPAHGTRTWKERLAGLKDWRPTRKQLIIIIAAVVVLGGGTAFALTHHKKPVPVKPVVAAAKPKPKPAPKPILSPLTGLPVTAEQQARPVTAVMIENSPDARPQSGLNQAGVVFEAIAEGGITRFMALYQESNPAVLGPVRSSRPYYLDWAQGFDAAYAHVGGSPDALQKIKTDGVKDLDQFFNAGAYHRVSTRFAPHNMYTSIDALVSLEATKGWTSSHYTPLPRKEKETPASAPNATSISMGISGAYYNVHYDYDKATNSYKRSEGGAVHIDNETKQQLSPKVVIALAMPYSLMSDGYHSQYQTIGAGKMLVFQDGTATSGTWSKDSSKDQFVFKDDANQTLALDPGQTWITAVDDIAKVTYQ